MSLSKLIQEAVINPKTSPEGNPKGWEPGVKFDSEQIPSEITTPPMGKIETAGDWKQVLELMQVDLPEGYEIRLTEAKYDPAAWHRDNPGESAVTRAVWRYKFNVVRSEYFTKLDLPALYAEVKKESRLKSRKNRTSKTRDKKVALVVAWADIQTGKVDNLGGLKEALDRLDEKRELLNARLKEVKPDLIILVDPGDIIEGQENVKSQIATNSLSLMDQVDVAATEFQKAIALCHEYAPVEVLTVPSNHCQARRGKELIGMPHDDWGLHINKRLEQLNQSLGFDVTFYRSDPWNETIMHNIFDTTLGMAHGHQASSGANGVITWWQKQIHAGNLDVDILLTGHFHHFSAKPSGRRSDSKKSRWWLQAPTLDNGSAWVANKFGEDGDPGLLTFIIEEGEGFKMQGLSVL